MISHPGLVAFRPLPLIERLFVRARLFSAPLAEVARLAKGQRILDVGCGHGLLCSMMATGFPERFVVGIDTDPQKIDWARRSVGRLSNTRFDVMTIDRLASLEPGTYDTVTVCDVLYLLPQHTWLDFLVTCRQLLRSGGQLLLKEAEDDGGWRTRKTLLQERLMVRLLRRTKDSGGLGFLSAKKTQEMLEKAGFRVRQRLSLSRHSSTPHVLFVADCV